MVPPVCQQGSHWFDLNDSTVTSIRQSDIEKQFQGKESAYMLFYRKTQLHRPAEGEWVCAEQSTWLLKTHQSEGPNLFLTFDPILTS